MKGPFALLGLLLWLAIMFVCSDAVSLVARGVWPQLGYYNRHTGMSVYNGPSSVAVRWVNKPGSGKATSITGIAISTAGVLYYGTDASNLVAMNASTGAVLWQSNTGGQVGAPTLSYNEATVFVGSLANKGTPSPVSSAVCALQLLEMFITAIFVSLCYWRQSMMPAR